MTIDAALVTCYTFGCLVIALHDGKLYAVGVCVPDAGRWRRIGVPRKKPVVSWAGVA